MWQYYRTLSKKLKKEGPALTTATKEERGTNRTVCGSSVLSKGCSFFDAVRNRVTGMIVKRGVQNLECFPVRTCFLMHTRLTMQILTLLINGYAVRRRNGKQGSALVCDTGIRGDRKRNHPNCLSSNFCECCKSMDSGKEVNCSITPHHRQQGQLPHPALSSILLRWFCISPDTISIAVNVFMQRMQTGPASSLCPHKMLAL